MRHVYSVLFLLLGHCLSSTTGFGISSRKLIPSGAVKAVRPVAAVIAAKLVATIPRGGGRAIAVAAMSRINAITHVSSVLGILNGIMYLFFTDRLENIYSGFVTEPGSQPRFVHRGVGAIALGQGLSMHFALIRKASPLTAIGVALLPRLLLSYYLTLIGEKRSYVGNFLKTNTALMTWVCLSVFLGVGNPPVAAKVFTTFAVVKGLYLSLAPVSAAKRFFETDVSDNAVERVHFQALGEHLSYSAVYMAALAHGVPPVTAAGVAAAVWASTLAFLHFDRGYGDILPNRNAERAYFGAALALAFGFLWPAAQ
jgi:hypothetical protein